MAHCACGLALLGLVRAPPRRQAEAGIPTACRLVDWTEGLPLRRAEGVSLVAPRRGNLSQTSLRRWTHSAFHSRCLSVAWARNVVRLSAACMQTGAFAVFLSWVLEVTGSHPRVIIWWVVSLALNCDRRPHEGGGGGGLGLPVRSSRSRLHLSSQFFLTCEP